jgi:hypothetical protein
MATAKKIATPQLPDKPAEGMVRLHSADVGFKDFTEAHAHALMKYQAEKGYAHWVPATDAPAETATA